MEIRHVKLAAQISVVHKTIEQIIHTNSMHGRDSIRGAYIDAEMRSLFCVYHWCLGQKQELVAAFGLEHQLGFEANQSTKVLLAINYHRPELLRSQRCLVLFLQET